MRNCCSPSPLGEGEIQTEPLPNPFAGSFVWDTALGLNSHLCFGSANRYASG